MIKTNRERKGRNVMRKAGRQEGRRLRGREQNGRGEKGEGVKMVKRRE